MVPVDEDSDQNEVQGKLGVGQGGKAAGRKYNTCFQGLPMDRQTNGILGNIYGQTNGILGYMNLSTGKFLTNTYWV